MTPTNPPSGGIIPLSDADLNSLVNDFWTFRGADLWQRLERLFNEFAEQRSTLAEKAAEVERLKQRLLTAAGDDLCRLSQEEIKDLTGGKVPIPPKGEFLASCERFHSQIAGDAGVNHNCLTLAQLIAENERLTAELAALRAPGDNVEDLAKAELAATERRKADSIAEEDEEIATGLRLLAADRTTDEGAAAWVEWRAHNCEWLLLRCKGLTAEISALRAPVDDVEALIPEFRGRACNIMSVEIICWESTTPELKDAWRRLFYDFDSRVRAPLLAKIAERDKRLTEMSDDSQKAWEILQQVHQDDGLDLQQTANAVRRAVELNEKQRERLSFQIAELTKAKEAAERERGEIVSALGALGLWDSKKGKKLSHIISEAIQIADEERDTHMEANNSPATAAEAERVRRLERFVEKARRAVVSPVASGTYWSCYKMLDEALAALDAKGGAT